MTKVYRSRGLQAVHWVSFFGFALLLFGAAAARWHEGGVLYAVAGVITAPLNLRAAFAKLEVDPSGIRVVNTLSSFDLEWPQIDRFEIGRWRWARAALLIKTRDGRSRPALAVGEVNFGKGHPARDIAEELNEELHRRLGLGPRGAGGPGSAQAELFGPSS